MKHFLLIPQIKKTKAKVLFSIPLNPSKTIQPFRLLLCIPSSFITTSSSPQFSQLSNYLAFVYMLPTHFCSSVLPKSPNSHLNLPYFVFALWTGTLIYASLCLKQMIIQSDCNSYLTCETTWVDIVWSLSVFLWTSCLSVWWTSLGWTVWFGNGLGSLTMDLWGGAQSLTRFPFWQ